MLGRRVPSPSAFPKQRLDTHAPGPDPDLQGGARGAPSLPFPSWALGRTRAGQAPLPGRPWQRLRRGGLQSQEGPQGGGAGREAGAGENPPGRHPEWLISADESLFSFRLNTLNRAPSDVYLHSLRANAGGGPRRRAGHTRAGGCRGSSAPPPRWERGGRLRGVSQPQPRGRGGGRGRPGSAFLGSGTRWTGQVGITGQCLAMSPTCMPAFVRCGAVSSSFYRWGRLHIHTATQQGTLFPRKKRSHQDQPPPTLETCFAPAGATCSERGLSLRSPTSLKKSLLFGTLRSS